MKTAFRPISGRASARLLLSLGAALIALPGVAHAQSECGTPDADGNVTCGTAGNPYAQGINYVLATDDLNVTLERDVQVRTRDVATAGVNLNGLGSLTLAGEGARVITTGAGSTGVLATAADDVAINIDTVSTSGTDAIGILAVGNGVSITAPTVTTTGAGAYGIAALGGENGVDVNFTNVQTRGADAWGVAVASAEGDIQVTGTNILASGANSTALSALSGSGNISIVSDGIIRATGAGGTGIVATSTTGDVSLNLTNVITETTDDAATLTSGSAIIAQGANVSLVATGGILTRGSDDAAVVTATAGDADVTVNGVRAYADGSSALVVNATGNAAVTINGGVAAEGANTDTVVISGDTASLTVGADGVLGARQGNAITISSVDGSTIDNAGRIPNIGEGYAIVALGGPVTINNSGSLTSDLLLTGGNDRINNSGEFLMRTDVQFGGGNDLFVNTGQVLFGTGTPGAVRTMVGLETFDNRGLIELRNGTAGETFVVPGNYVGSGNSRIGLDIGATSTDQLVIGGAATGNTVVLVDLPTGNAATFNTGTTLVRAGAASASDAFDLQGGFSDAGLVRYEIVYNPQNFSYSLTGGPSDAAYRTLNYVEGARNLWLKSADVVSGQLRARRDALWAFGGGDPSGKFWLQMHGSVESRDSARAVNAVGQVRSVNMGFRQDYYGGQLGFDISGGTGDRGGFAVGVTGGYISSSQNFAGSADRIDYDVVNGGAYASFTSGNFFVNALGKYDYYWAKATSPLGGFRHKDKGDSYGARGEVGMRFGGDSFFVEPAASLSWVKTSFDDFTSQGIGVNFDTDDGLRGRAGARIGGQFALGEGPVMAFYAGGNYVHEFKGEDRVILTGGGQSFDFTNRAIDDYGEAILGFTIGQTQGVSGFIEGSYIRSFKDGGRRTGIEGAGGRAGLRIAF
ncbi:outer membrane autotransporter protein [Sphingomonas zeicaulis]|uniref:autotransporter outer membrane beta-barrel domain-containing protein n=1 Tax=Sphingomonas zeicaulis TaxID=1632740 RepID=UPI003D22133A